MKVMIVNKLRCQTQLWVLRSFVAPMHCHECAEGGANQAAVLSIRTGFMHIARTPFLLHLKYTTHHWSSK